MKLGVGILAPIVMGVSGCITQPLFQKEAQIHFDAAVKYDAVGDYESAQVQYMQALMRAKIANASPAAISMLTYNFGRTPGCSCHLAAAEEY